MSLALSGNQHAFADELAKDTGLNLDVIDAWLRNEEPAISSNGNNGANNWLNIGITGSGSYGYANSVWDSPISAADATAAWMKGTPIGPGGYSSTGYPGGGGTGAPILGSVKESPSQQISAIQGSGWASGGETAMQSLYQEAAGGITNVTPFAPPGLTKSANQAGTSLPSSSPSSSGSSSGSSGAQAQLLAGGYIKPSSGLFSSLNPFNAVTGVWDAMLGDAKYAGLFIAVLAVGALLILKGVSANGIKTPKISVIPVPA